MSDSKFEPIPMDPEVAALLNRVLDVNRTIVEALCAPVRYVTYGSSAYEAKP